MGVDGEEHLQQPQPADAHPDGPRLRVHHRRRHHVHHRLYRLCRSTARKHLPPGICEYITYLTCYIHNCYVYYYERARSEFLLI